MAAAYRYALVSGRRTISKHRLLTAAEKAMKRVLWKKAHKNEKPYIYGIYSTSTPFVRVGLLESDTGNERGDMAIVKLQGVGTR